MIADNRLARHPKINFLLSRVVLRLIRNCCWASRWPGKVFEQGLLFGFNLK